jgi:hypothetical protein
VDGGAVAVFPKKSFSRVEIASLRSIQLQKVEISKGETKQMRFMMIVKANTNYEAGIPPSPELMAAIGKLSEDNARAGILVDTGGLLPSSHGARIRVSRNKLMVTDGPFAETKELVGGYAILQANSREEAIELGKQFMKVHADVLGPSYEGELEVRPMVEAGACAGTAGERHDHR